MKAKSEVSPTIVPPGFFRVFGQPRSLALGAIAGELEGPGMIRTDPAWLCVAKAMVRKKPVGNGLVANVQS
jgi:hypothetical protein